MRAVSLAAGLIGGMAAVATSIAGTLDGGGRQVTAGTVVHQGSLGGITGISLAAQTTAKEGFLAQLTEPVGVEVTASPPAVGEGETRQLAGLVLLDDDTFLQPDAPVAWSVVSGPLAGVDANGLATAAVVYEDTLATVEGAAAGVTGTLELTVLDTLFDNFGSYAGDGLGDDWQVLYFGIGNGDAGPDLDPDGDGQDNRFEWIAGLDPTDRQSVFSWVVGAVVGEPEQARITFGPLVAGRSYTVESSTSLEIASWQDVTPVSQTDNGSERAVVDAAGPETRKFYRVAIEKP